MPAPRGVFALLVSLLVASATIAATMPPGLAAAATTWPPSAGLVLAEFMTGGASASDEYVEIADAGVTAADLGGCELVYVTASGSTVTRKALFSTSLLLAPGQHLLVANATGIYGPIADQTYSGGLSSDGGALVLRSLDGTVIDAVGWGTAANAFVEGAVAPAPPAKSSLERKPGGAAGNTQDTNDNLSDWFIQPNPVPQSLASSPIPGPAASPSPVASPPATGTPTSMVTEPVAEPTPASSAPPAPTGTPVPSAGASSATTQAPTATPSPTATPAPTPTSNETPIGTPAPTASVTATPTVAPTSAATPTPAASPSSSKSPSAPTSEVISIAAARARAVGARVHVTGVVTVGAGIVGAADLCAIEDSTGGIFVRLAAGTAGMAVGQPVEVEGVLAAPYGQLEVRDLGLLAIGPAGPEPEPVRTGLGDIVEKTEGSLVTISGTATSVTTESGRLTITVGDGTTSIRVLADPPTGLSRDDVTRGDAVVATGIVGQRATATGRLDGYRLWLRRATDLVVSSPLDTATAIPSSVSPSPAAHRDLASALGTRNAAVDVVATVIGAVGLFEIGGPTIVVDDGTAAVAVVLPDGAEAPRTGMSVRVVGKVGRWEGGPTVLASQVTSRGELQAVAPRSITGSLDGSLEWRLVTVCGRIDKVIHAGSRWRADMTVDGHAVVVLGEPAAGITVASSSAGRMAVVVGIVRRSTSDPSVFQLLPRSGLDFRLGPASSALGAVAAARSGGRRAPVVAAATPMPAPHRTQSASDCSMAMSART
ncbi:MAG: lamin tail domain-containing protein [Candidatus Limnocylindrales bacterium]